jgi:hypothetical protein
MKKALFIGHYGLGDIINFIGAIRYISKHYDETHFAIGSTVAAHLTENGRKTIASFFSDDPKIKIVYYSSPSYTSDTWFNPKDYTRVYKSGLAQRSDFYWLPCDYCPDPFYRQLGFDQATIRFGHFHIPDTEASKSLYEKVKNVPYIYVIDHYSNGMVKGIVKWDINSILTVNPNINLYPPGHRWHGIANEFVNIGFLDHVDCLKHATEIHSTDGAFYALCNHIRLDAKVKEVYWREGAPHPTPYVFVNPY